MLVSKKEILNSNPPFLMVSANNQWRLVIRIEILEGIYRLTVVEERKDEFRERYIRLNEVPFYVGADIWELDYGATIKTLNHASLLEHPANKLWQDWQNMKDNN